MQLRASRVTCKVPALEMPWIAPAKGRHTLRSTIANGMVAAGTAALAIGPGRPSRLHGRRENEAVAHGDNSIEGVHQT